MRACEDVIAWYVSQAEQTVFCSHARIVYAATHSCGSKSVFIRIFPEKNDSSIETRFPHLSLLAARDSICSRDDL